MQKAGERLCHDNSMEEYDFVKHHYNRRGLVGPQSMLYRKTHPMSWKRVSGNYQTWEVNVSSIVPPDAESPYGDSVKLFYGDDLAIWLSGRKQSMPYFFRNCDADELHIVSRGEMTYETDFGNIEVSEREMLLIPKGVTYRALLKDPQETLRVIYESGPEIFLVPVEMIDNYYRKGTPALEPAKVQRPHLNRGPK